MAANSALVVSSLDFDTIRGNLVNFLQSQSQFQGYDFSGPNIGVLLDVLSYNTYLNNFYTNMAISESFLDSAQMFDSVASRAKELNYTPRSYSSAVAYVNLTVSATNSPYSVTIPAYTAFNTRMDSGVYTFSTSENIIVYASNNYTIANVAIYEGQYVTDTFVVNSTLNNQQYLLSNPQVDTSSLVITVQNSTTDTTNSQFLQASSLLGYNANSKIYFIQSATGGNYQLIFGDGIIGQNLINGNVITALYRVASGNVVNSADSFTPVSTLAGGYTISANTDIPAFGGMENESIDSIKYNAPRHYQTQNRAITVDDYRTILLQQFPIIQAVNVYGGETLNPPDYGSVYIAIALTEFEGLPSVIGNNIQNFIQSKMPIEIIPVVLAAANMNIGITVNVLYNVNVTTSSVGDIQNAIMNAIWNYNNNYLEDFDISFRYSKLAAAIDGADPSIVSTNLQTYMILEYTPLVNLSTTQLISLSYQNEIQAGSLSSTTFTYNGLLVYLQDMSNGIIAIVNQVNGIQQVVLNNVGTVNYTTGAFSVNLPSISAYTDDYIQFNASSFTPDFSVVNNVFLNLHAEDIEINAIGIYQ